MPNFGPFVALLRHLFVFFSCYPGFGLQQVSSRKPPPEEPKGFRVKWPACRSVGAARPHCRLLKALYGHPDSGTFWERHCDKALKEVGFQSVEGWESDYCHPVLGLMLSVYVDDFKLAGLECNLSKGWDLIRSKIKLDPPTPLGDYLGCGLAEVTISDAKVAKRTEHLQHLFNNCLLYTSPSPRDQRGSRMPSSA